MSAPFKTPVASQTWFDKAGGNFLTDDVQLALEELREQSILEPVFFASTVSGTQVLTNLTNSLIVITGTATGFNVQLPNATTLKKGMKYEIINTNGNTILIRNGTPADLFTLGQTSTGYLTLQDNSTAAGVWVYSQTFIGTATGILNYTLTTQTAFATTSTTDVVITGFTITPTAGTYAVWYNSSSLLTTTPRSHWWSIYRAGTQIPDSERTQRTSASNQAMNDTTMAIIQCNGSQALDVRVRTENGTLTINQRSLLLIRLGT